MYFIDLFKRILRKSNISLIIYLILNVLIISGCSALVFYSSNVPVPVGLLIGAALYALSLAVALSPFGEWLLRLQTGCKKICRTDYLNYIMPLFREVHERARELDPSVPADVQLFMNRMEHDDYRSVPELYQARCPECGAPLQNDEVWLKRGNTGYFTRAVCPYCGHWYLRFKLSRRDGLHWSFARCIDPATPEYDARWDKQKAALLERMKRKQERNIKE